MKDIGIVHRRVIPAPILNVVVDFILFQISPRAHPLDRIGERMHQLAARSALSRCPGDTFSILARVCSPTNVASGRLVAFPLLPVTAFHPQGSD